MYQWIAKQKIRAGFDNINACNFDAVVENFAPNIHFTFAGHHAIGADLNKRESVRNWFDRLHELFPDLHLNITRISVAGLPWDMRATTEFDVHATLPNGEPYHNRGVQVVRILFGKVIEDYIIEDTLRLSQALGVIRESGNALAGNDPLIDIVTA